MLSVTRPLHVPLCHSNIIAPEVMWAGLIPLFFFGLWPKSAQRLYHTSDNLHNNGRRNNNWQELVSKILYIFTQHYLKLHQIIPISGSAHEVYMYKCLCWLNPWAQQAERLNTQSSDRDTHTQKKLQYKSLHKQNVNKTTFKLFFKLLNSRV